MIKETNIDIKISSSNVNYYNSKGYKCNVKDIITIKIVDLMKQSTIKIIAICDICGKEKDIEYRKYVNNFKNKNFYVCSSSCAQFKIKLTKKENHNDPNFSNIKKREITCQEKYGNKNYKNIEQQKETNLEKYGCEFAIQNIEIEKNRKSTNLNKFGFDSPIKNADVKKQRKTTLLKRYGDEKFNNINKTLETIKNLNIDKLKINFSLDVIDYKDKLFTIKCEQGHDYKISYDLIQKRYLYQNSICTICNPIGVKYSDAEQNLLTFIKNNFDGEILTNNRKIISPFELDIYLPDIKIAFEYNGLFWHSELYKDKKYHKMKFKMCEKKNIHLIQILEDDWQFRQNIIKSMILNKLNKTPNKIYARKTEIKEVFDNILVKDFLDNNHIQGWVGSTIKLGLFFEEKLVSLMTFKKNSDTYELNRFCNILNTGIVGGASKLFKYFIKNYLYDNIISFSNNFYSNGNLYKILKFTKVKELKEDYSYIVDGQRIHKFNFRKNKNQIVTEREDMLSKNYLRLYDAGKIKFIYPSQTTQPEIHP